MVATNCSQHTFFHIGKMIVGKKWLQESVKKGAFADGDKLSTTDGAFERKHKFKLAKSLSKVCEYD
jgi:hypothetical protein